MLRIVLIAVVLAPASLVIASPFVPAGDLALRHDIQRLADYGVIRGTTSTWPLAWGDIIDDLGQADALNLPPDIVDALARLRQRAHWETATHELTFSSRVGFADEATRIRSYQDTPRGRAEVSAGVSWIGEWLSADLNVQFVDSRQDEDEIRGDNSSIGVVVGNWSVAASTMQRWWGPGRDGSLILSNNARPIPSLTIDRVHTDAFSSRWLDWLGPWDLNVTFGQLEKDRDIPNAQFFGMRFNFRPIPSLEIGLSRAAQWCGDGRPCDLETFKNLLIGRDNRGGDGINVSNEPGNQLGGIDVRWATQLFSRPVAFYGQVIGEDEAGGFPSRYLGQLGVETFGFLANRWSMHAFAEYAGTSCQFHESSKIFNCAYNHGIYTTGYRFRGRSIGHGADNDARLVSLGLMIVDADESRWDALIRVGDLNYGGAADTRNPLTPTRQDIASIDLSHSRTFRFGRIDLGIGFESIDDAASGQKDDTTRVFVQWRSSY